MSMINASEKACVTHRALCSEEGRERERDSWDRLVQPGDLFLLLSSLEGSRRDPFLTHARMLAFSCNCVPISVCRTREHKTLQSHPQVHRYSKDRMYP